MGEPMRVLTLRVPQQWADDLAERATRDGTTASELHRAALEGLLYGRPVARQRPATPAAPARARRPAGRTTAAVGGRGNGTTPSGGACRHPRADRQVHQWGSTCGLCGSRVP